LDEVIFQENVRVTWILYLYKYDLQITDDSDYDKDVGNIQIPTVETLYHIRRDGVHHIADNRHTSQDGYYLIHEYEIVANFIPYSGRNN
jgi:hypothetical protein